MTNLVGINGYARSGKDTAARVFTGAGWRRDAFADRIRDFLYAQDPIVQYAVPGGAPEYTRLSVLVNYIGWERAKLECPEIADLLLRTGAEAGREVLGEDVWRDALFRTWNSAEPLVITDVRFPNEAREVRHRGGWVIRINRPGVGPRTLSDGTPHQSDIALDHHSFDRTFINDKTPEDLHRAVARWAREKGVLA
jgi:hypothetical protein